MTGKPMPPASPSPPLPPAGGGLVSWSLEPDIKVTARALERLVGSLTREPLEAAAIISSAAFEAISNMTAPAMAIDAFRACVEGGKQAAGGATK